MNSQTAKDIEKSIEATTKAYIALADSVVKSSQMDASITNILRTSQFQAETFNNIQKNLTAIDHDVENQSRVEQEILSLLDRILK